MPPLDQDEIQVQKLLQALLGLRVCLIVQERTTFFVLYFAQLLVHVAT